MRIDKAKQQLGYQPHFDFEQGMVFTAEYLRWARLAPQIPATAYPEPATEEVA